MRKVSWTHKIKRGLAKVLRPFYFWLKKRRPDSFARWIADAGSLDLSGMLTEFNALHRLFFRDTFTRIQIDKKETEKIRQATHSGPIIYMMRNWGQIEYNFFNSLFLKEKLPLATHANLIRMHWWMPVKTLFAKWIARLDFFYEKGEFPEFLEADPISATLLRKETPFVFLNLPSMLGKDEPDPDDMIFSLLKAVETLPPDQPLTLIPLTLLYDRRPGKARKSVIDILFGERENPGSLRKIVLFFRNYKKRAVAQAGDPIDLKKMMAEESLPVSERAFRLRNELHRIFFQEQKVITGPRLKSRRRMIEMVMQDKALRSSLMNLSTDLKKPIDQLYLEGEKILEEIIADPNYTAFDLWSVILTWVFKNIYDGLTVDEEGLSKVRQVARQSPLVLVPSHRSHVDYLLLSYIFFQQNLSMPLVAAGKNLSFWPMGYIFRKSGAYFIRRSFGNDKLYPILFKAYAETLIQEGYFQEFFIEGTRSRSGKLERPRTGLLSLYMESFLEGRMKDLYFVPISINYEKVLEEKSYIQEVKGGGKEKERFWDLFRLGKYLKHRSGQVYVNFAEPLSLKAFMESEGLSPGDPEAKQRAAVKKFAYQIAVQIENVSLVTAPALIAAALLAQEKKGQTLSQLFETAEILRKALSLKNVSFSESLQKNYPKAVHNSLARYKAQGLLQEHHDGLETFFTLEGPPRLQLNYYKNSILDKLIHLSLLATLIGRMPEGPFSEGEAEAGFEALKNLFAQEFIRIRPFREALFDLSGLGAIEEVGEGSWERRSPKILKILASLLNNFLESYTLGILALERLNFQKMEEKVLIQKILDLGHTLLLKGDLLYPEAVSQFTLQNVLYAFRAKGLVATHEKEMGKAGRKIYSNVSRSEDRQSLLTLLRGETPPKEKSTPPLYLLQK